MVNALLGALHPLHPQRVVNMGASRNSVRSLRERWETNVLDLNPDWLSIMSGINDVWRQFDSPLFPKARVPPDEFQLILEDLVLSVKDRLEGLVLMTPFFLEPSTQNAMRTRMDEYGAIILDLAQAHGAIGIDTQQAFNQALRHQHSSLRNVVDPVTRR